MEGREAARSERGSNIGGAARGFFFGRTQYRIRGTATADQLLLRNGDVAAVPMCGIVMAAENRIFPRP